METSFDGVWGYSIYAYANTKKGESITILLCFNVGVDGFEPPTLCL